MPVVCGILNVNKPSGPTSFDVVRVVRRGTGEKRVGHAGTLDPMASGVLLVCLGQATRIVEYLMEQSKVYRAQIRLGIATETYDAEGTPMQVSEAIDVARADVERALQRFTGDIEQTPPAHSAVKVGGRPAYRLARKGATLTLSPRRARIYRIDLLAFDPPDLEIEVKCGKGTYIRSLAHDLGQALGCGAHLASLVRTRSGPFTLESAVGFGELQESFEGGRWAEFVRPMDIGLGHLPALTLGVVDEQDLRHGQPLRLDGGPAGAEGEQRRAYGEDGSLIGIVAYDAGEGIWRPRKVFAT